MIPDKSNKDYLKSLSPEAKAEIKQNRINDKQRREDDKIEAKFMKEHKALLKKAKAVLTFMKKTDVLYYHHNTSESIMPRIIKALEALKQTGYNTKSF